MKLRWVHSLLSCLAASVVSAAPAIPSDVVGPLGLVRVSGGGYHEGRDAARAVEDVFHRLATLGGRPWDTSSKPFVILVLPASDWGPPSLKAEASSNGLPWRITLQGSLQDNIPDLRAHLARLALSLWAGQGGRPLGRGDWLAVGLAGTLFPADRAHNRLLTQQLVDEGRLPTLDTLVTWNRMPDGPMMEKAACAQAVSWLTTGPRTGTLSVLVEQLMREPITGDWLLALESGRSPDPEAAWRLAAAKGDILAGGMRPLSPMLFSQFRKALLTPPRELGLDRSLELPPLSPYQLLAVRGSSGVREAARARSEAIQKLAIGTPPELVEVALGYKSFFDGLAGRTPAFLLRRRLTRGEQALRRLEDETAARTAWVDEFDEGAGRNVAVAPFERSALEQYVDEVESRLEATPAAQGKEAGNGP